MFLIIAVIAFIWFISAQNKKTTNRCEKQHKWIIRFNGNGDKRGYLMCKECGQIPGED